MDNLAIAATERDKRSSVITLRLYVARKHCHVKLELHFSGGYPCVLENTDQVVATPSNHEAPDLL